MIKYYSVVLIYIAILCSCASESAPTGGPIDKQPPELNYWESYPDSVSRTNFTEDRIQLVFNERIAISKFQNNFISNPELNELPKYTVKNNKLIITFNEALKANTTYVLSLDGVVEDITEHNVLEKLSFAFSTGSVLDSLSFRGSVINNYTNEPESDLYIGLFPAGDSLNPYTTKPSYVAKPDASGKFTFRNLNANNYKIFAYDKKQAQNTAMIPGSFAFVDTIINPEKHTSIELKTFTQSDTILQINSLSTRSNRIRLLANKDISNVSSSDSLLYRRNTNITFFYPLSQDTTLYTLSISDSLGNKVDSTINYSGTNDTIQNVIGTVYQITNDRNKVIVSAEYPIKQSKPIQALIDRTDTVTLDHLSSSYYIFDTIVLPSFTKSIQLLFDSTTLTSPYPQRYKFVNKGYNVPTETSTGILGVIVETQQKNYIIQLVNASGKVVEEVSNVKNYSFNALKPDTYKFRVIIDTDNNQSYTSGNFFLGQQVEKVIHLDQTYLLKANWEIDDIKLTF